LIPHFRDEHLTILSGDCREKLRELEDESVQTIITSPPYWALRDYGHPDQIGQEPTMDAYIEALLLVFREAKRVLRNDGTLWLNLGDSYAGSGGMSGGSGASSMRITQPSSRRGADLRFDAQRIEALPAKNLLGIPWRVAFALQADGWILRSEVIWHKPNQMPESVTDRPTKAHEHLFLFAKNERYYYDAESIREELSPVTVADLAGRKRLDNKGSHGGVRSDLSRSREDYVPKDGKRNKRSVWTIHTAAYSGAHFAVFPPELVEPCVLAGSPAGGTVLDPFGGSGTTALVANRLGRKAILIELNPSYIEQIEQRNAQAPLGL